MRLRWPEIGRVAADERTRGMRKPVVILFLLTVIGCGIDFHEASDPEARAMDPQAKYDTLAELLANPHVQEAIARLPAGTDVAAGDTYRGDTPASIDGTWTTDCCGGADGRWLDGGHFGGTTTFQQLGPGRIDVPAFSSEMDSGDGKGSFIVGTGNHITVFVQMALTCKKDGEHIRMIAVDRFVLAASALSEYTRSYVVIARDDPNGPWECATDEIGAGALATQALFVRKQP
jgi:hypothetical protein